MVLSPSKPGASSYVLGYATDELSRLIDQARFYGDLTAPVLHLAGLGEGRVLLASVRIEPWPVRAGSAGMAYEHRNRSRGSLA